MNSYWLVGWKVIISIALIYELIGFVLETFWHYVAYPTLSTIIVTLIPLNILIPLTLIIALVLVWHWIDVKKRLPVTKDFPDTVIINGRIYIAID